MCKKKKYIKRHLKSDGRSDLYIYDVCKSAERIMTTVT